MFKHFKKYHLIFIGMMLGFLLFAIIQRMAKNENRENLGGGNYYQYFKKNLYEGSIVGALSDTSSLRPTHREISHHVWAADTSGDDSVGLRLYHQHCTDPTTLQDWATYDSTDIEGDSVWTAIILSGDTLTCFPYRRTIYRGLAGNKKESAVIIKDQYVASF